MEKLEPNPLIDNLIDQVSQLFLSKEQLANALNISPRSITAWRYKYETFPARKLGRHVRYSLPEVLEWHERTFGGPKNGKKSAFNRS